jgi:site-specific recombinase XerD
MQMLREHKERQKVYADSLGNKWEEHDRLFTQWNGKPMSTNAPSLYFERFCTRHGLKFLNIHSMRHLNASIQIFAGIDVKAVQISLGHSQASTTLNLYTHAFQAAQAASMDGIVNVLGLPQMPPAIQEHTAQTKEAS